MLTSGRYAGFGRTLIQRIRPILVLVIILSVNPASSEPLSETGFELTIERRYQLNTLTAQDLDLFLKSETYPFPKVRLYNICRWNPAETSHSGGILHICISGDAYRFFEFPDLILTIGKDRRGDDALILWTDTPIGLSLIEVISGSRIAKDQPLTLKARQLAERSNTQYSGRFVEELIFEVGTTSLTFANYNSYDSHVIGEGPGKYTSNFKIQETWMTEVCENCFEPIIEVPLLKKQ